MSHLLNGLAQQASPWIYIVVGGLALLEASAFVGLFIPGELALLAGGYVVQQGQASLMPMLIAAALGAIVGDSLGYEIGRHFGPRLQRSRLGRRVGEERWEKAHDFLDRRGGPAIFLGRFVGLLRALVPAAAGTSRMPYRRFLLWNALGGLIWAPGMVLLGYLAGSSYRRVEHFAGQASLVLLIVVTAIGVLIWTARWAARHQPEIRSALDRQAARPVIRRVRRRYSDQFDFALARLDPRGALGLGLTAILALLVAATWAFGSLVIDLLTDQDVAGPDHATLVFMIDHRSPWLTPMMRGITSLGSGLVLVPLSVAVAAIWLWRRHDWLAAEVLGISYAGASLSFNMVKRLTRRARPPTDIAMVHAGGYAFPSGHATQAAAMYGALAFLACLVVTTWPRRVAVSTTAIVIAGLVGLTRLYLGVHWLSDVLAGWALGTMWLLAVLVLHRRIASGSNVRLHKESSR